MPVHPARNEALAACWSSPSGRAQAALRTAGWADLDLFLRTRKWPLKRTNAVAQSFNEKLFAAGGCQAASRFATLAAIARARGGGTALPICRAISALVPHQT